MKNEITSFVNRWKRRNRQYNNYTDKEMLDLLNQMNVSLSDFKKYDGCIDMHIHTNASDGEFNAHDIIFASSFLGLRAISITDHNTTIIYKNDLLSNNEMLIEPGTEIITTYNGAKYHILAYGDSILNNGFQEELKHIRQMWNSRFYDMLEKVDNIGTKMTREGLKNYMYNETYSFADLVKYILDEEKGYSKEYLVNEVFGCKKEKLNSAYICSNNTRYLPDTLQIIELIKVSGARSILAHCPVAGVERDVLDMKDAGLHGIELYHPNISETQRKDIYQFARSHNLRLSGGSDYHGTQKVNLLGKGCKNNLYKIPFSIYANSYMDMKQIYISLGKFDINDMTIEEKVAYIIKPSYNIYSFDSTSIKYMRNEKKTYSRINKDVIDSNKKLLNFVHANINANTNPIIININQEGGKLNTIDWNNNVLLNGNYVWGKIEDDALVNSTFKCIADELRNYGITWNLAPVADILKSTSNTSLSTRCFGKKKSSVTKRVCDFVSILQGSGVATTVKHFPGVGYVDEDGHTLIPRVNELQYEDLEPFISAIDLNVASIMISDTIYENIDNINPALMSYSIITELLRQKLNYKGVIVTDNISMPVFGNSPKEISKVAVKCFLAGADVILFDPDFSKETNMSISFEEKIESFNNVREAIFNGITDAVRSGRISMTRLNKSVRRVIYLHEKYGVYDCDKIGEVSIDDINLRKITLANKCAKQATKIMHNRCNVIPINYKEEAKIFLIYDVPYACRADSQWKYAINIKENNIFSKTDVVHCNNVQDLSGVEFARYKYIIYFTYNLHFYKEQQNILDYITKDNNSNIVVIATGDDNEFELYEKDKIDGYISASCRYEYTIKAALNLLFNKDID